MKYSYSAVLERRGRFVSVTLPSFPALSVYGVNSNSAVAAACEVLKQHLKSNLENNPDYVFPADTAGDLQKVCNRARQEKTYMACTKIEGDLSEELEREKKENLDKTDLCPIIVEKRGEHSFTAYPVSDAFVGACSEGNHNMQAAMQHVQNYLQDYVDRRMLENAAYPDFSVSDERLQEVHRTAQEREEKHGWEYIDAVVHVRRPDTKAVRVNISVPRGFLKRLDAYAERVGTSRSAVLTAAAVALITERG